MQIGFGSAYETAGDDFDRHLNSEDDCEHVVGLVQKLTFLDKSEVIERISCQEATYKAGRWNRWTLHRQCDAIESNEEQNGVVEGFERNQALHCFS